LHVVQAFSPVQPGMPAQFYDPNIDSSLLHQDRKLHFPFGTWQQKPPVFENNALPSKAPTQNPPIGQST
jgi:hypothetical protein